MTQEKYDIAAEMFRNLQAENAEKATHVNKLSLALTYLSKAANILDNMQDFKSSEQVTRVIEKIAK